MAPEITDMGLYEYVGVKCQYSKLEKYDSFMHYASSSHTSGKSNS